MKPIVAGATIALMSAVYAAGASAAEIIVSAQTFTHEALTEVLEEFAFTDETGHTVRLESSSAGTEDIARLTAVFRAGRSPFDVLMASDEVFASFVGNGWLAPLDDVFDEELAADFPDQMAAAIDTWSRHEGAVHRIPFEFAFSIYWTRSDLLEEWGLRAPESWDDLEESAAVAKENGLFGFADALGKGAFGYVYLAAKTIQAGGDPFACDDGLRTAIEWTNTMLEAEYFPRSAINMNYDQLNQEYLNDRLLTIRQWPYFYSVTRDNEDFYADGKADAILPPMGPATAKVWTGGHGWSVPASAPNMDGAKAFVEFITRPEVQIALAERNSFFVIPRLSLAEAMADDDFVAILNQYVEADAFAARPFHPRLVAAQGIVEDAAHAYWTGQMDLDEAMDFCVSQIEALGQ